MNRILFRRCCAISEVPVVGDAAGAPGAEVTVRRAGGPMDAQAQAAALAAGDFAAIAGVGDAGRAAIGQAHSAAIGADIRWVPVR